jgi:polyphosphate kinase
MSHAAPDPEALRRPELYINRELAALAYYAPHPRAGQRPAVPPLERLRFLCLSCTSLDKFFEIRVGGLKDRIELGASYLRRDGLSPADTLAGIAQVAREHRRRAVPGVQRGARAGACRARRPLPAARRVERGAGALGARLFPRRGAAGADAHRPRPGAPLPAHPEQVAQLHRRAEGLDAFGREAPLAVVQAPRSLARIIRVPPALEGTGPDDFVFLSSIIHAFVGELFAGLEVTGCHQFRVTRHSELSVDDEDAEDLMRAVVDELASRRYGDEVRLEVASGCPAHLLRFLLNRFGLGDQDLYEVNGPVNLNRLSQVIALVDRPDLKHPRFVPGRPRGLTRAAGLFDALRRGDVLLHHPYQSFAPVVELLREAAADPDVLAIKQTLYRTGADSPVVDALAEAARAGKEVTVVVELMARFNEAENIALANRLQRAGAHVVYGVVGYKTHAKLLLVVRRENGRLRRYVHLGTGNYHLDTARDYADYSLMSCNARLGRDVHEAMILLTSPGARLGKTAAALAPLNLHERIIALIRREAGHAAAGRPARIVAKLNAVVEPEVIEALYAASCAGVEIDLVVRGACCLRPGVPGVSERIRVRSLVGRFLEHARVLLFANGGRAEAWLSSADWMERNFFRRVDICFRVPRAAQRRRLAADLALELADNCQAWELQPDGRWQRAPAGDAPLVCAQAERLAAFAEILSGS